MTMESVGNGRWDKMVKLKITDVRAVPGDGAFLIDDGKTAILYDTGFAFTGYAIADKIRKELGGRSLDYIFLTHSHYDHALGSVYVTKRYPEAKVVAGAYAAEIFRKPSARSAMRELDRKASKKYGMHGYEDLIEELKADIVVNDGDIISCGDIRFEVIGLPGHTKCSIGFYHRESSLLLGSETLGVYFGNGTYLPSYLVGYQMTLDSFRRAGQLDIERILLPHYGVVGKAEAKAYLENAERVSREFAQIITEQLRAGKTTEEVAAFFTEKYYTANVAPTYPIDAFRLNTGIMIDMIRKEFNIYSLA